jgi:N-acyl-D-aspartate/D-glutamate deacylase
MASAPANRLGLIDRGVIRERSWADLDIFNNHTVANQATDIDSPSYPVGIPGVIVNGVVVIDRSRHTDNLPGHVL